MFTRSGHCLSSDLIGAGSDVGADFVDVHPKVLFEAFRRWNYNYYLASEQLQQLGEADIARTNERHAAATLPGCGRDRAEPALFFL